MKLNNEGEVLAYNRMDPLGADTLSYDFINYLVMDPNDDDIIYMNNGYHLWRNNDAGNYPYNNSQIRTNIGWEVLSDTTTRTISCIDVSTNPPNTVYVGTSDNYIYRVDNAHEGDPEMVQLSSLPIGFGNKNVSAVEIDPTDNERVMAVVSNYSTYSILFTDNGGQSWKRVAGNLEDNIAGGGNGPSIRTAEIAVLGSDTLYIVGGSTGLYATNKLEGYDTEWRQIGTEVIGNVVVENIRFRDSDGKLVVGTHGTGVYSTKITSIFDVFPDLVSIRENNKIKLSIYPNPSQNEVNIEWDVNEEWNTLQVVDINGRVVHEKIINSNSIKLETSNWNRGTYFINLIGKDKTGSKKLILN